MMQTKHSLVAILCLLPGLASARGFAELYPRNTTNTQSFTSSTTVGACIYYPPSSCPPGHITTTSYASNGCHNPNYCAPTGTITTNFPPCYSTPITTLNPSGTSVTVTGPPGCIRPTSTGCYSISTAYISGGSVTLTFNDPNCSTRYSSSTSYSTPTITSTTSTTPTPTSCYVVSTYHISGGTVTITFNDPYSCTGH